MQPADEQDGCNVFAYGKSQEWTWAYSFPILLRSLLHPPGFDEEQLSMEKAYDFILHFWETEACLLHFADISK